MLDWLADNWSGILAAIAAIHTAAVLVTRLTPTKTDDEFVAKIHATAVKIGSIFSVKK